MVKWARLCLEREISRNRVGVDNAPVFVEKPENKKETHMDTGRSRQARKPSLGSKQDPGAVHQP